MLTFEQAQEALTQAADRIPREIYRELNGGIVLLPDTMLHPESIRENLYILGQYNYDPVGFGRYIVIYFGSFIRAHGKLSDDEQIKKLEEVLFHELTHHLESLAGDVTLELRDKAELAVYFNGR